MTDNNHLITPPRELVEQWVKEWADGTFIGCDNYVATQAARWGADQELEECCEWIEVWCTDPHQPTARLRAARRPKPPSLKEQALALIETVEISQDACSSWDFSVVRRALEQLND